jgi:hypothetical protein
MCACCSYAESRTLIAHRCQHQVRCWLHPRAPRAHALQLYNMAEIKRGECGAH